MPFPSHLDRADCGFKGEDQPGRGDAAVSQGGGHLLPLAPGHNPRGITAIQLPLCKILVPSLFQTTRKCIWAFDGKVQTFICLDLQVYLEVQGAPVLHVHLCTIFFFVYWA